MQVTEEASSLTKSVFSIAKLEFFRIRTHRLNWTRIQTLRKSGCNVNYYVPLLLDFSGNYCIASNCCLAPCLPIWAGFFYLQPNSEQAEKAERVHLAALVGVGEEEGAKAPGREYGEGRHEGGRGGRAQVVKAHTLKG